VDSGEDPSALFFKGFPVWMMGWTDLKTTKPYNLLRTLTMKESDSPRTESPIIDLARFRATFKV